MNKTQLTDQLAMRTGISAALSKRLLIVLLSLMAKELRNGNPITLTGIGVIEPVKRAARSARNPRTGEKVEVPERMTIRLRPSKTFKDSLNADEA